MSKSQKHYYLSDKNIKYVNTIQEKYDMTYASEALDLIIREHSQNLDITTEYMIGLIAEKVSEEVKKELVKIKLASNSSDRNSQILIELINGMFIKMGYKALVTTSEEVAEALKLSSEEVDKRIASSRTKKYDTNF